MSRTRVSASIVTLSPVLALLAAACGGTSPPSPAPTPAPATPPAAPATATPSPTADSNVPATLDAPDEVAAGAPIEVTWTGPNAPGDFVAIVSAGTESWTIEPYFNTLEGSPSTLVAPTTAGDYDLVYFRGADRSVATGRPISVTPAAVTLSGPESVEGGTEFSVEWTGPDGPGDHVTIVEAGAESWSGQSYFDTAAGSPGVLVAPVKGGGYELWYVNGAETRVLLSVPVVVVPPTVTLEAPASVTRGAQVQVTWTGPDSPGDYITIVPAGSPPGTYLWYAYTNSGSPVTIVAPDQAGMYEIRYESDRIDGTFASTPIEVR